VGVFGAGAGVVVAVVDVLDALPLLAETAAPDFAVVVLEALVWASVALETELLEPVVFVPDAVVFVVAFDAGVVAFDAGVVVVATGVVVVAALCAAEVAASSLPHPANTRASTTPVVTVSFRGTGRTIAPAVRAMCWN
jgi:hypothetical protein